MDNIIENKSINFETGKTYETRSACDYNCIYEITITRRTKQWVFFTEYGKPTKRKVFVYDGVERIKDGNYSMAPQWAANREQA